MKVHAFVFIAVVLVWVFAGGAFATTDTALQFNGSSDFVAIPNSSVLSPQAAGQMTLSVWIEVSELPPSPGQPIIAKGTDGAWEYGLSIRSSGQAGTVLWRATGSNYAVVYGGSISINQWHNITTTYEQNQFQKLYVDGSLVGQTDSFNPPLGGNGPSNLYFGTNGSTSNPTYFNGALDDVSLWNYAMTDAQVQQLYNTPLLTGSESGLAAYWNFNEGSGLTVNDITGNGNNGALGGNSITSNSSDPTWVAGVPEPATMALLAFGGIFLRRSNKK